MNIRLRKLMLRRWRIILNKFNKDKGKKYDFRDIEVELHRNVPQDEASRTDMALKLRGLLSDESVINLLPCDLDAISELEKVDKQNQENIEKNLEQMQMMGQDVSNVELNTNKDNSNKKLEQDDEVKKENVKQSDTITKKEEK